MPISTKKRISSQEITRAANKAESESQARAQGAPRGSTLLSDPTGEARQRREARAREIEARGVGADPETGEISEGEGESEARRERETTVPSAPPREARGAAQDQGEPGPQESETPSQRKLREALENAAQPRARSGEAKPKARKPRAKATKGDGASEARPSRAKPARSESDAAEAPPRPSDDVRAIAGKAHAEANEIIDAMTQEVSLDEYFDRDPKTLRDEDFEVIITSLRAARHRFTKATEDRKAKRNGETVTDE